MPKSNSQQKAAPSVLDLEERTWLGAHLRGDQQAFAKLMQAYRKPVYSFLVRNGIDSACRDDVFQEVFLKIHKSAHSYQANRPLSPWIFTIAINTIRNFQRKVQPAILSLEAAAVIEDEAPSPDSTAQLDETIDWLEQAVIQLPPAQAEAFTLSIIKGMKIKQVSEILGLPLNTIKTQLRRARQTLLDSFQSNKDNHPGVKHDQ
ncbi:RNA polymerase sigma-70 factor (ECF subfamily) [Marinicella litoralis]|uniref:RNA polymerase sigma-70 factor (ECF subfamily) n=2 Tax=Marinicella litoralis TaxID=644220 RepID=A0A4R6XSU5_9GAMM|nr:RNA polymerase sigma-70 factor (ECF subfamily) [Marinicella litoralis]